MESGFEILAGTSRSGKTYTLCTWVLKEANKHPENEYIVVVPEQVGNEYEKKLIEMNYELFGHPGFMNIDVLGFGRLAYRIFTEFGIRDIQLLEEYEKNMLVRVAGGHISDKLTIYQKSVGRVGFTAEVKSLISEFLQYGVEPEDIEKVCNELGDDRATLRNKLGDVRAIYEEVKDIISDMRTPMSELSSGLPKEIAASGSAVISEEKLKLLTRLLKSGAPCSVTDGVTFIFDEYRGYTPDQLAVIGELGKRAECLKFALCIDKGLLSQGNAPAEHHLFHKSYMTYRSLVEKLGRKPKVIGITGHRPQNMLSHLSSNIFRYPYKVYSGDTTDDHSLEIYTAKNLEEEIRLVAQSVRENVKSGLRYKDMVVCVSDVESFDSFAGRIFDEYEIPVFFDYSRKLKKNPFTEAIIRALKISDRDYDYDSVFGFVKTGVCDVTDIHALDKLENHVLKTGIRGKKMWNRKLRPYGRSRDISEGMKNEYREMNKVREEILECLSDFSDIGKGQEKVSIYISAIRGMMERLSFEEKMEKTRVLLEDRNMMSEARVMGSLYNMLDKILTQTDLLLGQEEMQLHEFIDILSAGISEIQIGVIPPTLDALHVCDTERSRIVDAKAVYLINVNDGVIPVRRSSGRILSDKDKEEVIRILEDEGIGKTLADTGIRKSTDDLFQLYQIMSKPSEKLVISYSDMSMSGDSIEPSYIIGRIRNLFSDLRITKKSAKELMGTERSDRLYYIGDIRNALEIIHSKDNKESDSYQDSRYNELMDGIVKYMICSNDTGMEQMFLPGLTFSNTPSAISDEVMSSIDVRLSVSKLESFADCPYSYFMQYILGLREREEKKIESYDVGNILHRALELTINEIKDLGNDWNAVSDEELKEKALEYLDLAWEENGMDFIAENDISEYEQAENSGTEQGEEPEDKEQKKDLETEQGKEQEKDLEIEQETEPDKKQKKDLETEQETEPADGKTIAIYNNLKELLVHNIDIIKKQITAGKLLPFRTEQEFTAEFTAHRPDGSEVPVLLKGKIDRIDTLNSDDGKLYIRVIDYKTGSQSFDPVEIKEGTTLQLSVYAKIIEEIMKKNFSGAEIIPAGMYYYHIKNDTFDAPESKLKDVMPDSEEEAVILDNIRTQKLRLDGVSNGNPVTDLNIHDNGLVDTKTGNLKRDSNVIEVSILKDGSMKDGSLVISGETLEAIEDYSVGKMLETADKILSGCIDKAPVKMPGNEGNACTYCSYKPVCRFSDYSGKERVVYKPKGTSRMLLDEIARSVSGDTTETASDVPTEKVSDAVGDRKNRNIIKNARFIEE